MGSLLSGPPEPSKPKLLDEKSPTQRLAKIASVLVRLNHVASFIVNPDHSIM
jgi:hypothetical protein